MNLADGHLTYIGCGGPGRPAIPADINSVAVYEVYPRDDDHLLGFVYRARGRWWAIGAGDSDVTTQGRTRWEAATAMWGWGT